MCIFTIRRSWALLLFLITAADAQADEVPRYNVKAICIEVPTHILGTDVDRNCIADETLASTRVDQRWASFDAKRCREFFAEAQIVGPPSYVAPLSCHRP